MLYKIKKKQGTKAKSFFYFLSLLLENTLFRSNKREDNNINLHLILHLSHCSVKYLN